MQEDNNQETGWTFKTESNSSTPYQPVGGSSHKDSPIQWSASEYVANPRGTGWFLGLTALSVLVAALIFMITRDVVSTVAVLLIGLAVGIFSARKPKVLNYTINDRGIQIGIKQYPYAMFRSFSILQKGSFGSIYLMPLKRFMPPIEIHFELNDQERITSTLADYLPFEERSPDLVDTLFERLRF